MDQQVRTCYNFSPLTACLAVNYLDRFLSLYQLPVSEKRWKSICAVSVKVNSSHFHRSHHFSKTRLG
jgi:hypothetical protein